MTSNSFWVSFLLLQYLLDPNTVQCLRGRRSGRHGAVAGARASRPGLRPSGGVQGGVPPVVQSVDTGPLHGDHRYFCSPALPLTSSPFPTPPPPPQVRCGVKQLINLSAATGVPRTGNTPQTHVVRQINLRGLIRPDLILITLSSEACSQKCPCPAPNMQNILHFSSLHRRDVAG